MAASTAFLAAGSILAAEGWDSRVATIETLALLQTLLRQDTTNPPGNEVRAARVLGVFFNDKGIGCELVEPAPGRGSLLCKVKGSGEAPPLLVVARLDVAPAAGATSASAAGAPAGPPGGPPTGLSREGRMCGRGLLSGKGMAAAAAEAVALLGRQGGLKRDVIFVGTADGESTGELGLRYLIQHHPQLLEAALALTGGGAWRVDGRGEPVEAALEFDAGLAPVPDPLRRALAKAAPGARIAANQGPRTVEAALLNPHGVPTYGLHPFPLGAENLRRAREAGECSSIETIDRGVRLMVEMVREIASG